MNEFYGGRPTVDGGRHYPKNVKKYMVIKLITGIEILGQPLQIVHVFQREKMECYAFIV